MQSRGRLYVFIIRICKLDLLFEQDHPDPASLLQSKSRKRLIMTGASRFNTKPKVGLSFLEENKLIYADLSEEVDRPKSLARFLKSCTRLNKRLLGDFISRPENVEVLRAFIRLFDFKNVSTSTCRLNHLLIPLQFCRNRYLRL